MKIKFTSGWLKAIGLTTGLASAIVLGLIPNSVHAQQPNPSEPTMMLKKPAPGAPAQFPELEGINLTSEQQEQIKQIQQEMQPKFEAVLPRPELTAEQQAQIEAGNPVRIALPSPTLEQEEKLKELKEEYRQKIEEVLTPEQQEQFRQNQERNLIFLRQTRGS